MEMPKIDKEFLIKHRFWITVGAVVPLAFMALGCLVWGVDDDIKAEAAKVQKTKKDLDNERKKVKTDKELAILEEKNGTLSGQKEVVWNQAWGLQQKLFAWPKDFPEEARPYQENFASLSFGDLITDNVCARYPKLYADQIKGLPELVAPSQFSPSPEKVLRHVEKFTILPLSDDLWLAQEDYCVKKEVLLTIQEANNMTARFSDRIRLEKIETPAADEKKGEDARQKYRNSSSTEPNYELDLVLTKNEKEAVIRGKVKSMDKRPVPLTRLYVQVQNPRLRDAQPVAPVEIKFAGEPLKPDEERPLPETRLDVRLNKLPGLGLFDLEQKLVSPPPDKKKGESYRERFINPYWELDLILAKNVLKGTIKNIGRRRQAINRLTFEVSVRPPEQSGGSVSLVVEGEPLPVGKTAAVKETTIDSTIPAGIFAVREVLDIRTAPVKFITAIALGEPSHRTIAWQLQPPQYGGYFIAKGGEEKDKAPGGGAGGGGAGMAGGGGGGGQGMAGGGGGAGAAGGGMAGGGMGGGGAGAKRTENGVELNRYISVTEQVRHMPIGVVLIVDQNHVQDVLTAFANSRLRFQTTQVRITHKRGIKVVTTQTKIETTKAQTVPSSTSGPGKKSAAAEEPPDPNLVELVLYGTASLYERYKKPAAPAEASKAKVGG